MINVSKARNHAILNATCIRAPIFCTRNRHLIVRKSRCVSHFVFSTGISSPLSFFFYFFSFISQKHDARPAGTKSGAVLLLRLLLLPLLASIVPLSLSLSFSSFSFSSSFIFIPLFRTRCDPISVHTCTNCENGIPRTLKDNCFPIDLRSRLLAIRHCICTFALRQHQRCHV